MAEPVPMSPVEVVVGWVVDVVVDDDVVGAVVVVEVDTVVVVDDLSAAVVVVASATATVVGPAGLPVMSSASPGTMRPTG